MMSATPFRFDGTLECFAPFLPAALVAPGASRRLRAVAEQLPAAIASWAHLECRLDARQQVDLIVQVEATGRATLVGRGSPLALPALRGLRGAWAGASDLARAWADGREDGAVGRLWLELDLDDDPAATQTPQPSTFIEVAPAFARPNLSARRALFGALARLARGPVTAGGRVLARCIDALPPDASLYAVGAMTSRPGRPLRLCCMGIRDDVLAAYLRDVRWPGDWAAFGPRFAEAAAAMGPGDTHAGIVHLDIYDELAPPIGVELVLNRAAQVRGRIVETGLLDLLVEWGCCLPAKRKALAAWPGVERRRLPHELWPSLAARRVNHVKLQQASGAALHAKAYLCLSHAHDMLPRVERTRRIARVEAPL